MVKGHSVTFNKALEYSAIELALAVKQLQAYLLF